MNFAPSPSTPISPHRLARFCKAARLLLLRAAGWLMQVAGESAPLEQATLRTIRPFVRIMTRFVYALMMLKAMARCEPPLEAPPAPAKALQAPCKAMKQLRAKASGKPARKISNDPRALIAALLMLLQNIEAHARRLARRLRNGSARRIGRFSLEPRAPLRNVLSLLAPACADTS